MLGWPPSLGRSAGGYPAYLKVTWLLGYCGASPLLDAIAKKRMTVTEESQILFFETYLQKYEGASKRSKRVTNARYNIEERRPVGFKP